LVPHQKQSGRHLCVLFFGGIIVVGLGCYAAAGLAGPLPRHPAARRARGVGRARSLLRGTGLRKAARGALCVLEFGRRAAGRLPRWQGQRPTRQQRQLLELGASPRAGLQRRARGAGLLGGVVGGRLRGGRTAVLLPAQYYASSGSSRGRGSLNWASPRLHRRVSSACGAPAGAAAGRRRRSRHVLPLQPGARALRERRAVPQLGAVYGHGVFAAPRFEGGARCTRCWRAPRPQG
jgi:hypothetical protein